MKHAREDYDRIQDPDNLIPQDEPVFLVRAQDLNAPATLLFWAQHARNNGASDKICNLVVQQAQEMLDWQTLHNCKVPDLKSHKESHKVAHIEFVQIPKSVWLIDCGSDFAIDSNVEVDIAIYVTNPDTRLMELVEYNDYVGITNKKYVIVHAEPCTGKVEFF